MVSCLWWGQMRMTRAGSSSCTTEHNRTDLAAGRDAPWQSQVSGAGGQETPNPGYVTERRIAEAPRAGSGFRKEAVGAAGQSWAPPSTWLPPAAQTGPGMGRPLAAKLGAAGLCKVQEDRTRGEGALRFSDHVSCRLSIRCLLFSFLIGHVMYLFLQAKAIPSGVRRYAHAMLLCK